MNEFENEVNNPINDRIPVLHYQRNPTECPICGSTVINSLYWFECNEDFGDCDWMQGKEI
jgi:hypothetical protein